MKYANCPLFNGINDINLKHLLTCLKVKEVRYQAGDLIWSNSDSPDVLGVILTGKAFVKKLNRNGDYTILETLIKNSVFSDKFAFSQTELDCIEIHASEATIVIFISLENVFKRCQKACQHHSQFVMNLMQMIIDKSKTLSQRVELLSNKSIKDKILSYCSLMLNTVDGNTFTLPMSYTNFAEYLCVDRSAMMRELKKLNDKGILAVNKKQITVLSSEYI